MSEVSKTTSRMQTLLMLLLYVNAISSQSVDQLGTLKWTPCNGALCATLYFCAAPAKESWQFWNVSIKQSGNILQTFGDIWPNGYQPSTGDPNGANTYLYGYRASPPTPGVGGCVPGVGPIIRVQPGKTYKLTLNNTADKTIPDGIVLQQMQDMAVANVNMPGGSYYPTHTTNLHTHGFHQSGQGGHDNVLKVILPGECDTYTYVVPADLQGGMQWYHAHSHGKAVFQLFGGALGPLIVEDTPQSLMSKSNGALDSRTLKFFTETAHERIIVAYLGFWLTMGNGNPRGTPIQLTAGQWHRCRVLYANPEALIQWTRFVDFSSNLQCDIKELAWDGTYASTVPYTKPAYDGAVPFKYAVHGAERVEFAIRCVFTAPSTQQGKFRLKYGFADVSDDPHGNIALFTVDAAAPPTDATPYGKDGQPWEVARPDYLADLRDGGFPAGARLEAPFDLTVTMGGLNGKFFNLSEPTATFSFGPDTIHQINFKGTPTHPTHMHTQVFQVVKPGGCGPAFKEGERYDTISTLSPDESPFSPERDATDPAYNATKYDCLVRFRNIRYAGPQIIHCHVLDHEDMGIMGWFDVPLSPGCFELSKQFLGGASPQQCCAPRVEGDGSSVCRRSPQSTNNAGWDTCNQPCTLPTTACGGVCYDGSCYATDRPIRGAVCPADAQANEQPALAPSSPALPGSCPAYPWVITGVALGVAVLVVVGAWGFIHHRRIAYSTLLLESAKEPVDLPTVNTPYSTANLSPTLAFGVQHPMLSPAEGMGSVL